MQYFFQAGVFQNISHAEIVAVFQSFGIQKDYIKNLGNSIFILEKKDVDPKIVQKVFSRLGGYIRYGEVVDDLDFFLTQFEDRKKIVFGISNLVDTNLDRKSIVKLSNEIKRHFKDLKIASRFVLPKNSQLNEAQIRNNNILEEGFEFCIFESNNQNIYGKTLGIQDVVGFVHRDIDKPFTDYKMGVLPQKLARIMCNLTGLRDGIIWDPFCGSGTILMEASMLGLDILGSDISEEAIRNTEKNILWMKDEGMITGIRYNLFEFDILEPNKKLINKLKKTNIGAVVCEPYMGSAQKSILTVNKADSLINEVDKLYTALFNVLDQIAKPGFKVVFVVPSYKTFNGDRTINISKFIQKRWKVLNREYSAGDLIWKRKNSIITRNIFILSKK